MLISHGCVINRGDQGLQINGVLEQGLSSSRGGRAFFRIYFIFSDKDLRLFRRHAASPGPGPLQKKG